MTNRTVIIEVIGEVTIQFCLRCAFAVIEKEGDQGGEVEFTVAGEGGIGKAVLLYKAGVRNERFYAVISIFKFALRIALR